MEAVSLERGDHSYLITIQQDAIDHDILSNLLARLRLEYLLKKADFDESVETMDEEIKEDWWKRNGEKILNKINLGDESSH